MRIPRIETLLILVFLTSLGLWAASKCSSKRAEMAARVRAYAEEQDEREDRPVRRDTVVAPRPQPAAATPTATQPQTYTTTAPVTSATAPVQASPDAAQPKPKVSVSGPAKTPPAAATDAAKPAGTTAKGAGTANNATLYVTIDGLNMRKTPGLKGETVAKLELYEPVYFLNEKTEWTQEISLGYEKVTDHWVKVRTKSGKQGWVFGAGVHYYKMKRKGVIN